MAFFNENNRGYFWVLLLFVLTMGFLTIFGERGLMRIYHLSRERDSIKAYNDNLRVENEAMKEEIERLKYDNRYMEAIARKELGMVGANEIVYRFER